MEKLGPDQVIAISREKIIDMIRKLRNDLIKDFLDERYLLEHFSKRYHGKHLSKIKIEFIKKDLRELLISPVDTRHYAILIDQISRTGSASITERNEKLFYDEVERILKNVWLGNEMV